MSRLLISLIFLLLLASCAGGGMVLETGGGFAPGELAKTDIDHVAETHVREACASLRLLTEELCGVVPGNGARVASSAWKRP